MDADFDAAEFLAKALGTSLKNYMPATQAEFRKSVSQVIKWAVHDAVVDERKQAKELIGCKFGEDQQ